MENLNFMPETLKKKYECNKIQKYKITILLLWIICLLLFISYTIAYNKGKLSNSFVKKNDNIISNLSEYNFNSGKNTHSIITLRELLDNLEKELPYETMMLNDRRVDLELALSDEEQYYKIIDFLENKAGYKILYLSPLYTFEEKIKFKISVEVV
jgi:hypothetical protein